MDDLLADIVADGEEENQVTVDAEESCFINGSKVSWRVEEVWCGRGEGWWDQIHACPMKKSFDMGSLIKSARVVGVPGESDSADACGGVVEVNWPVARGQDVMGVVP